MHRKVHRNLYSLLLQWLLCTARAKELCPPCIGFALLAQRSDSAERIEEGCSAPEGGRAFCAIGSRGWGGALPS